MDFKYPNNAEELDDLLEYFLRKRAPSNKKLFRRKYEIR